MKGLFEGLALLAVVGTGYGTYTLLGPSNVSDDYERSEYYAKCDTDYIQSGPYLGYRGSSSECECFDDKLQQLTPAQRSAAYKSLEDKLTLAFMGKAGAKVSGSTVSYNDRALGKVVADVTVETSGVAIMEQCSMF